MANIKSAKKRILVNGKKALRNKMYKSLIKTSIRKAEESTGENKEVLIREALRYLDRAVSKGILKRNTVDRKKSLVVKRCKTYA